jgi:hypothetical protein
MGSVAFSRDRPLRSLGFGLVNSQVRFAGELGKSTDCKDLVVLMGKQM